MQVTLSLTGYFFYPKIFGGLRYAPVGRGVRSIGGVLSASSGDKLRLVESGVANKVRHGFLCSLGKTGCASQ